LGHYFDKAVANLDAGVTTLNARSQFFGPGVQGKGHYGRQALPYRVIRADETHGQDVIAATSGEASMPGPVKGSRLVRNPNFQFNKTRKEHKSQSGMGSKIFVDKRISVPAAQSTIHVNRGPRISRSGSSMRVQHKEMCLMWSGSTNFAVNTFDLNPGISITFPWLSIEARGYESYRVHSCTLQYVTRGATNVGGNVVLAFDPDANDAPPSDEFTMASYEGAVDGPVWSTDLRCHFDRKAMMGGLTQKYCRYGPQLTLPDYHAYDFGQAFIATSSTSASTGRCYIEYDIELLNPRRLPILEIGYLDSWSILGAGGGITRTVPFGLVPVLTGGINMVLASQNPPLFTIGQTGTWQFTCYAIGTGLNTSFTPNLGLNYGIALATNGAVTGISNAAANVGTTAICTFVLVSTVSNASFSVDFAVVSTTITGMFMTMTPLSFVGNST